MSAYTDSRAIVAAEKRLEALELRKRGYTYREIAEAIDRATQTASNYVKEALAELAEADSLKTNELRLMILERNNLARKGLFPLVEKGDPQAVNAWIRLNQEDAKLFGLYAPKQVEMPSGHTFSLMAAVAVLKEAQLQLSEGEAAVSVDAAMMTVEGVMVYSDGGDQE